GGAHRPVEGAARGRAAVRHGDAGEGGEECVATLLRSGSRQTSAGARGSLATSATGTVFVLPAPSRSCERGYCGACHTRPVQSLPAEYRCRPSVPNTTPCTTSV